MIREPITDPGATGNISLEQMASIHDARVRLMEIELGSTLDELIEQSLNEIEMLTTSRIGFFHFVKEDEKSLILQNWSTRTKREFCKAEGKGSHYRIDQAGVWVDCVCERKPVIHNDYAALTHKKGMPAGHAEVIRELLVPVLRGGKIKAILGVGNKPTDYHEGDIQVVVQFADLAWDLIDRKLREEELRKSNELFKTLASVAPVGIYLADAAGNCLYANPEWCAMSGLTLDEALGAGWSKGLHPDDRERVFAEWRQMVASGKQWKQEYRFQSSAGKVTRIHGIAAPIHDVAGEIIKYVGVNLDVTDRYHVDDIRLFLAQTASAPHEEPFFKALARYLAMSLEMDFVCIDRLEGGLLSARTEAVWCDGHFEDNVTYALRDTPCGEVVGSGVCFIHDRVRDLFPDDQVLADLRAAGYAGVTLRNHSGHPIGLIALISRKPLYNYKLVQSTLDLVAPRATRELERILADEELLASLHEKEALLKEIHHRVKNNLQIISSLLRLQSGRLENPVAKAALLDTQNRVRSMALVHEKLYRSDKLSVLDMGVYLEGLSRQLVRALVEDESFIQVQLDVSPVRLGIDQAVACGLLVNELVSNALKHAFPAGRRGVVRVAVRPVGDGSRVCLRVSDDGIGMPAGIDVRSLPTLGLQLAFDLARQLGGRLEMTGAGPGAEFVVEFQLGDG